MSEKRYHVEVPRLDYYRKIIKCQYACPVHTHAGGYVVAISEGKYEEAYSLARSSNPFPYVCGRVCAHPCEDACRRGDIDQPVAIRALKRVATDQHDLGLGHAPQLPKNRFRRRREEKIAVIGSGPAGLSASHDLAILGYSVTVFEASPVAGGMLHLGLPTYRLSRDIIKLEIDAIRNLGVDIRLNMALGKDFTIEDLKRGDYHAIFIAVGAHKSRHLNIEGMELDGVLKGVEFLLNANLGFRVSLGEKVVVIGGGNVAIDVARSSLRQTEAIDSLGVEEMKKALEIARGALRELSEIDTEAPEKLTFAMDVARSALRLGAKEVHMVCLESREEMPANDWEIEEALGEGVILHTRLGPKRILGEDGRVRGLETLRVRSVFDAEGRFNPSFIEETESVMSADTIIVAIGQASDLSFIREEDLIEVTPRKTITVDPETLATSAPGIFAGGDVAFGPRLIIDAIADGQKAAKAIDQYITGRGRKKPVIKMWINRFLERYEDYDRIPRQKIPTLPTNRRVGIAEVELGFPDGIAIQEGKRCLKCNINTIFNSRQCLLCGGCVSICPMSCYRMVKLDKLQGDEALEKLIEAKMKMPFASFYEDKHHDEILQRATAMIKDESLCIRCGLCEKRCPTGAVTMETFQLEEVLGDDE